MEQSELSIATENAISFFQEVESFNFSMKHIDMFDKLGARNFEKIKTEAMKANVSFPYSRDFVKTSLEANKLEAIAFHEQLLGQNSGKALLTLPIEKQAMDLFDGATLFHYDGEERTIIASKIILFRTDLSYNALSLVHENTHILFNNPAPYKGFHIHYNELLPILMELIATIRFEETLKDPNLLKHYIDIRIKTLRDHIAEYTQGLQLRKAGVKNHIIMEYSIHNSYSYIIATIYALRLFELYKEEPRAMKKWIQDAMTHQRKVEDLLADTNVSLKDKDTIKATEKVLKMYQ